MINLINMKKRLFIVTSLDQGGLETYLLRFLRYDDRKHYNIVLCKAGVSGILHDEFVKVTDEIVLLHLGFLPSMNYWRFFHLLCKQKISTVCDFTGNFAGLTMLISMWAGVSNRITFFRESVSQFKPTLLKNLYVYFLNKLVLFCSTRILSNSKVALNNFFAYTNIHDDKFHVVYNGIDIKALPISSSVELKTEFGFAKNDFIIGHVGRYVAAKNHDTMIKVATILCKRYKNIHFCFFGKGVLEQYDTKVQKLGLEKQIHLMGYRLDVMRILPLFDIFYFPSLNEGQPNALIEAMVLGIPIIASNIPSIQETVPDALRSLLIPPKDIDKTIDCIEKLFKGLSDKEEYKCREWASQYFDANKWFSEFQNEL